VFVIMSLILFFGALGVLPIGGLFGTATVTFTPRALVPPTFTLAPTQPETPAPTPTPLPPIAHTVVQGDSCISLAARYNVSVAAILDSNGLSQACPIFVGQRLSVPQPTHTPTAPATNTLSVEVLTQNALPRTKHTVVAGDTLLSIAARYGVDVTALARENGIVATTPIRVGQVLTVPLYAKAATAGPTPTATALPPYPAPALLSPANGASISSVEQNVVLQWTAVDLLKQGEAYMVTVEDVTCNCAKRKQEVTNTTRYILNIDLKPAEITPHVFKWNVVTVRRTGTSTKGDAIYQPAGATSDERTFTWAGVGGAVAPTKQP
jgi:LysM repeat protein